MKRIIILLAFIFIGSCNYAYGQTAEPCPADRVCISRDAAIKAIADAKQVEADKAQIAAYEKAIADYKQQINDIKLSAAAAMAENSILKQIQVRDAAMIELLLKMTKKKRNAFITIL